MKSIFYHNYIHANGDDAWREKNEHEMSTLRNDKAQNTRKCQGMICFGMETIKNVKRNG